MTSVLRTVLDYYESFFQQPCIQLKLDIFKATLYLANCLFDSQQQYTSLVTKLSSFEWLQGLIQAEFDDQLMPLVNELVDESVLALGVYAESLCRCCLQTSKSEFVSSISSKDFERSNKLFENSLKSGSLSLRIAALHGIFYWLESITLGFIGNNNDAKQIIDHLCKQVKESNSLSNPRYLSTLWSAVFYAIENCMDSIRDTQAFISLFIKQTYVLLNDPNTPHFLFYQLYLGLERLLLSSMIPSFEVSSIQRLLSSKFCDEKRSLCLTSLTVTSLYAANQSKNINYWNDVVQQIARPVSSPINSALSSPSNEMPPSEIRGDINKEKSTMSGYPQILELTAYPELQEQLFKGCLI